MRNVKLTMLQKLLKSCVRLLRKKREPTKLPKPLRKKREPTKLPKPLRRKRKPTKLPKLPKRNV